MALGRISPFRELDKQPDRQGVAGENLTRSALETGPLGEPYVGGSGTSLSTPPGNANVTGLHGGLANLGLSFASLPSLGIPSGAANVAALAGGGIPGLVAGQATSVAAGKARSALANMMGSNLISQDPSTQGQQVTYTGPTTLIGLLGSLFGGAKPTFTTPAADPFGLANEATFAIPSQSPHMTSFAPSLKGGTGGAGIDAPSGHVAGVPVPSPTPAGYFQGGQVGGEGESGVTPTASPESEATFGGSDIGTPGAAPGTGPGVGPGGAGDAGVVGDLHRGGFVDLESNAQAPRNLNEDRAGSSEETGEVQKTLEQGEFVVNKESAGRFGPLLNKLNDLGRNKQLRQHLMDILEHGALQGLNSLIR